MKETLRLLIIEDVEDDAELLLREIRKGGFQVKHRRVETAAGLDQALENEDWQIILADYNLPQFNAPAALKLVQEKGQTLPFVVVSGKIGEEAAVKLMRLGARDYIPKDNLSRLLPVIRRELEEAKSHRRYQKTERERQSLEEQLFQSQKIEAVGRLAGGVAHDYNNMLSVIIGYAELASMQIEPSDALKEPIDQILMAAKRSRDITRQLLAFARKQTINPKVLDLNATLENMLKMLRQLLGENIDLSWQPREGLWPIEIDPSQLDQILANLCINARDAIADTGKLTIETDKVTLDQDYCSDHQGFAPGDFVMLEVSDDGCGMNKDTLGRIFDPFFTTKPKGVGTGLGLSTVYGTVKQSNGFINVYSEPGNGTTFRIYFPRYHGERLEEKAVIAQDSVMGHGEQILLVEDERQVLTLTEKILVGLGYNVLAIDNPKEALTLVEKQPKQIDLLISDVVMPDMNGRELAEKLKVLYPELRSLFMSGYTENAIAHRGILDEGIEFIPKPFSRNDLAAKVKSVLSA